MSDPLFEHFALNDDLDPEKVEEDIVASLLGVVGYAAQSLELRPGDTSKVARHLRSESLRLKAKVLT